ncbi:MAG: HAD family hydrolase [Nocardioides sp.]|nr:HAD family hydrolase [Nocardioides sp.]
MNHTDTVVLDLDGTLVDSVYEHVRAWRGAFLHVGLEVPAWRIHRAIGMGGDRLVAAVTNDHVEDTVGEEVRRFHDEAFWRLIGDVRALPGADALLQRLADSGHQAVLASSSPGDQVQRMLEVVGEARLLAAVVTGDDVGTSKPAPDIVQVALERAGTSDAVMIGDTVWDVESARRAGIGCLGLRTGGISDAELRNAGARDVYDDPDDLAQHLPDALAPTA